MALDPSIALGVRPIELPNQLAQYGQLAAIQNAQNQNALAQYQLGSAQRAEAKDIARTNALTSAGTDDAAIAKALLNSGDLKGYSDFIKTRRETQKADVDLADAKLKQSRGFLDTLDPADPNAPAQYIAWHEANHKDPILGPLLASRGVTAEQSRARIMEAISKGPAAFATLINQSKLGSEKFIELNKPQLSTKDTGGKLVDRTFEPLSGKITEVGTTDKTATPGELLTAKTAAAGQQVTMRGQNLLDARAKENIAIAKESQRREADPAFQQQLSQARALGVNIAKDKVVRDAALPKVLDTAEMTLSEIDGLIGKRDAKGKLLEGEKPHPGFEGTVGATYLPGMRFIPGTAESDFQTRFDQIKGNAFLQAFETLKGGGSITNVEGEKGTAALNRMSLAQSEPEFLQAAQEFKSIVTKGVERAKKLAGGTGAAPNAVTNPEFPGFSVKKP